MAQKPGAFRSEELLNEQAWVALLKSTRVADGVVLKLALYLKPENPARLDGLPRVHDWRSVRARAI